MRRTTVSRTDPPVPNWFKVGAVAAGILAGYLLGFVFMETFDVIYTSTDSTPVTVRGNTVPSTVQQQQGSLRGAGSVTGGNAATQQTGGTGGSVAAKQAGDTIHSVLTSNGSPYQNFQGRIMGGRPKGDAIHSVMTCGPEYYQAFQARIMYGTYKLVQKMPGGEKLTGFTRVLHRMKPDELMEEIPTFRANPLHPACDVWCDFPVADRPNAVRQWIEFARANPAEIKGAWILLLEADYVWMKPVKAPDAADLTKRGFQFMFDYIQPTHPDAATLMRKLSGGLDPKVIPASGPAPVLIRYTDLDKVAPQWETITAKIEADPVAVKTLDWVREMYAWDIALALENVTLDTESPPHSRLLAQPPHDLVIGDAAMLHYTWGTLYFEGKTEIWRWEKRDFTSRENALHVPHLKMPPTEWKEGWKIQDGLPVTKELHQTMLAMIGQMNKAIDTLPNLLQ